MHVEPPEDTILTKNSGFRGPLEQCKKGQLVVFQVYRGGWTATHVM